MFSLGKKKPRSLKSFGIAGLLNEDAQVFYDQAFSLTHIGGATDLLAARIKKSKVNEVKFRKALLMSYLDAFERMSDSGQSPVQLECGIDGDKIVIGVSYVVSKEEDLSIDSVKSKFIAPLEGVADFTIFKFQPTTGKCESVAIFSRDEASKVELETDSDNPWFIELGQNIDNAPKIKTYEELGDLDKAKLLGDQKAPQEVKEAKVVIKEDNSLAEALKARKETKKPELDESEVSFSSEKIEEENIKVKGTADYIDGQKVEVKGEGSEKEKVFKISGESEEKADYNVVSSKEENENDSKQLLERLKKSKSNEKRYIAQILELQNKIKDLQDNLDEAHDAIDSGSTSKRVDLDRASEVETTSTESENKPIERDDEDTDREEDGGMFGILKGVWDSKKAKASEKPVDKNESEVEKVNEGDPEEVARSLEAAVEGGQFDQTIERVKQTVQDHAAKEDNDKAKEYAAKLIHDLNQEKATVRELVKKLGGSLRLKEIEFKNKERAMRESLRKKDDEIRQKQVVLQRTKDQLSHTSMNLERYKTTVRKTASEGQFKKKYEYLQQAADKMKVENGQLKRKIEELKSNLNQNRATPMGGMASGGGSVELKVLRDRNDKITKGYDEEKRKNRNLMERLADADRDKTLIEDKMVAVAEKLDKAIKVAMDKKRDNQRLKGELEKLEAEKMKLARKMKELERALNRASAAADSNDEDIEGDSDTGSGSSAA